MTKLAKQNSTTVNERKENTMKKEIRLNTFNEKTIFEAAQKDLDAYNKGEKSFEVMNYLKDELVINGYDEQVHYLKCSPKALNRIINPLSYLRQTLLTELIINVCDTTKAIIKFKIDMSTVSNGYRRVLNQTYNLNIPEIENKRNEVDDFDCIQF